MSANALLNREKEGLYKSIVWVISIAIPLAVTFMILFPQALKIGDVNVSYLPAVNAALNSLTAVCLLGALFSIRGKNISAHKNWMMTAFAFSALFLICYVMYHSQAAPTRYGDYNHDGMITPEEELQAGAFRYVYFAILIFHIILAAVILPFILLSFYFSLSNQIDKHKKLVRFTWPVWFFVAVSGVVVYFMIRPFYPH